MLSLNPKSYEVSEPEVLRLGFSFYAPWSAFFDERSESKNADQGAAIYFAGSDDTSPRLASKSRSR